MTNLLVLPPVGLIKLPRVGLTRAISVDLSIYNTSYSFELDVICAGFFSLQRRSSAQYKSWNCMIYRSKGLVTETFILSQDSTTEIDQICGDSSHLLNWVLDKVFDPINASHWNPLPRAPLMFWSNLKTTLFFFARYSILMGSK